MSALHEPSHPEPRAAILDLIQSGVACVLTPTKGPSTKGWPNWRTRCPNQEEAQAIASSFEARGDAVGIAMILGRHAPFVTFDFDAPGFFDRWFGLLSEPLRETIKQHWPIVVSPKGYGRHVHVLLSSEALSEGGWFTDEVIKAKLPLHLAHVAPKGEKTPPIAIELRLPMKHAVMVPGSGFGVHDKHPDRTWTYLREDGPKLSDHKRLSHVSREDFHIMVEAAKQLDDPTARASKEAKRRQLTEHIKKAKSLGDLPESFRRQMKAARKSQPDGLRPGDDFNERGNWEEVLSKNGWTPLGDDLWRRPEGTGISASTKFGFLYVFTTNAYPLEDSGSRGAAYTKFTAYAFLHHDGDFAAAAKELGGRGFGEDVTPEARIEKQAKGRSSLMLRPGETSAMLDELAGYLQKAEASRGRLRVLFQRDGVLLMRRRSQEVAVFDTVTVPGVLDYLSGVVLFMREGNEGPQPADMPEKLAKAFLARGHWSLPELKGVTRTPILLHDGSVSGRYGYDSPSGVWLDVEDPELQGLGAGTPDCEAAIAALHVLREPFAEFPWKSPKDESMLVAGILTVLGRNLFDHAPLFAITATAPGTGKSMLVDCVSLIATESGANMIQQTGETEMRKTILAQLLDMPQIVCINNVEHPLCGAALCSVLTESKFGGRILGKSKSASSPTTNTTWFTTGNNLSIQGDLTRRTLLCELDADCERPGERKFEFDPKALIKANRSKYVAAGLEFLRAFLLLRGESTQEQLKPFGSFESWGSVIRSSLAWAGLEDPCSRQSELVERNSERSELQDLVEALEQVFGGRVFLAREVHAALSDRELGEAIRSCLPYAGDPSPMSIGRLLAKYANRWVGGKRITDATPTKNTKAYRIETRVENTEEAGQ